MSISSVTGTMYKSQSWTSCIIYSTSSDLVMMLLFQYYIGCIDWVSKV